MAKWEYRGQWNPDVVSRRSDAPVNRPLSQVAKIMRVVSVGAKNDYDASVRNNPTPASPTQLLAMRTKLSEKVAAIGGMAYLFSDKPEKFTGMRPVSLFVGEVEYPIKNWRDLIIKTCDEIAKNKLDALMERANVFVGTYISKRPDAMRTPYKHAPSGLYLELYLPPSSHINHARELFVKFGYDIRTIGLAYINGESDYAETHKATFFKRGENEQTNDDLSAYDTDEIAVARKVFEQRFPNGMRTASVIDQNKFRRGFEQEKGSPLRDDFEFDKIIPALGVVQGEKVFPIADEHDVVQQLVQDLVDAGHTILYYDEVFVRHNQQLGMVGVQSGSILRALLQKRAPSRYEYGEDFLIADAAVRIPDLIEQHFDAECVVATYEEASSWLPYIPANKIRDWIGWDKRFQKTDTESFVLVKRIKLDEDECRAMVQAVKDNVASQGFASKWCVRLPKSRLENPGCSESVLNEIFFDRYLADQYNRQGLIITSKGVRHSIVDVCRKFCEGRERVSTNELVSFAHELGAGRAVSLGTAADMMVRVGEDEFVSDDLVAFDVEGIDRALEQMIGGPFAALVSIKSFVMLPSVNGFTWNSYLLGSYCRRFSSKFKLMDGQANGYMRENVCGAIVRKDSGIDDYVQLQVEAVRQARVEMTVEAVGDFLFENKYVLRRRGMVGEVINALMKS